MQQPPANRPERPRITTLAALFTALLAAPAFSQLQPPQTRTRPVTDTLHGVAVTDPYRWLEGRNTDPDRMGITTPEVADWSRLQNDHTRAVLDAVPARGELEARLRELMQTPSISTPIPRGDTYFFSRREGDQPQPVVFARQGLEGPDRVLLDPNALSPDGLTTISWINPNHDGSLLAFGMYQAGDENPVLHVLDTATGSWLAEEIPGKVGGCQWVPGSTATTGGFYYRRLRDLTDPYSNTTKFHRMGTHHSQDTVLFQQNTEGPLATTWGPAGTVDRDARWMIKSYWTGTSAADLWSIDLTRFSRTGEWVETPLLPNANGRSTARVVGDTAIIHTTHDHPAGAVFAVDLLATTTAWTPIIPERDDAVLHSISVGRGVIAARYLKDASTRIELFTLSGEPLGKLPLPGIGTASIAAHQDRDEAFLTFSSFNTPRTIYRVNLKDLAATPDSDRTPDDLAVWKRTDVPVDPDLVTVTQVRYPSKDGTPISMFIVAPKGVSLDGNNPVMLDGYGGFKVSKTPRFDATLFPWFEAGGVYALANLRGGGEYGAQWHRAGTLENKQNVFDDFIAAAEYLIDAGYTNPQRLGIHGRSNGGLLTGACAVQRPDLFAAAYVGVPLLDMLRYQSFLMARFWVPEYGTAENPDHLDHLLAYSPYHNVNPGTDYPAMLITAGENDTRVHPMHARKFAARVQAATTAPPA
ncbi:MAG: prolyl oligopeptidase family serine peptidase [Planctomycetota bacterium]